MVNTPVVMSQLVKTVEDCEDCSEDLHHHYSQGCLALYQEALTRHIPLTCKETFFFQDFRLTGECFSLETIQTTQAVQE